MKLDISPWPDLTTARRFLGWLSGYQLWAADCLPKTDVQALAGWLLDNELAPFAYQHCRSVCPELADHLRADSFSAAAENSLYFRTVHRMAGSFRAARVPLVLLKGTALARLAYGDVALRTMCDVDVWVQSEHMPHAARIMQELGFDVLQKEDRPLALQQMAGGEIEFLGPYGELVDLHWSPFPGWWFQHTTAIDSDSLWSRLEPLELAPEAQSGQGKVSANVAANVTAGSGGVYLARMSVEDMIIHVGVHLSVNHRFSRSAVRSLLDIALMLQHEEVDWQRIVERAQRWRLKTALWSVLYHLHVLFGLHELQPVLRELEPSRLRRRLLLRLVPTEALLASVDLKSGLERFVLWLLLVDRPVDMLHLVYRTMWPERAWLAARYHDNVNHWQHLWRLLRYGQV